MQPINLKRNKKKKPFVLFKHKTRIDGIVRPDLEGLPIEQVFEKINEWWDALPERQKKHLRTKAQQQVAKKRKEKGFPPSYNSKLI